MILINVVQFFWPSLKVISLCCHDCSCLVRKYAFIFWTLFFLRAMNFWITWYGWWWRQYCFFLIYIHLTPQKNYAQLFQLLHTFFPLLDILLFFFKEPFKFYDVKFFKQLILLWRKHSWGFKAGMLLHLENFNILTVFEVQ